MARAKKKIRVVPVKVGKSPLPSPGPTASYGVGPPQSLTTKPLPGGQQYSSAPPPSGAIEADPTMVLGTAGVPVFGGFITSPEQSPDLAGINKYKTYSNFKLNCDVVSMALRYINTLIKGTQWHLDPSKDGGTAAQDVADALYQILLAPNAMARPWNKIVIRQAQSEWDGFAVSEWIASLRDDGLIGFADIQPRTQGTIWRWDVLTDGSVQGFWQLSPWTFQEIYLPRGKCVYSVDGDITDSPDGTGRLRHIAETARQLKRYEQIEGWDYELDLGGVPVGKVPYSELNDAVQRKVITEAQKEQYIANFKAFITNRVISPGRGALVESRPYKNDGGEYTSTGLWDLQVLPSNITSFTALHNAIERKTRQIARILGIEGLLLGGDGKGSLALSKDKAQQLAAQITSMLADLAWTFDHDLVAVSCALNGFDKRLIPSLVPEAVQLRDVEMITKALVDLAQSALAPDDPADDAVRDLLDIPHKPQIQPAAAVALKPKKPPPKPDAGENPGPTGLQQPGPTVRESG